MKIVRGLSKGYNFIIQLVYQKIEKNNHKIDYHIYRLHNQKCHGYLEKKRIHTIF